MNNSKPLEFKAGALDYFIYTIVTLVLVYIPFIGWAILLNYTGSWFADRAKVTGKEIEYKAGFGESLKFVFVNFLLLLITLGIYSFWFYPKMYRYVTEHVSFVGESPVEVEAPATPAESVTPEQPATPAPIATEGVSATPAEPSAPEVAEATPEAPSAPETITPTQPQA